MRSHRQASGLPVMQVPGVCRLTSCANSLLELAAAAEVLETSL